MQKLLICCFLCSRISPFIIFIYLPLNKKYLDRLPKSSESFLDGTGIDMHCQEYHVFENLVFPWIELAYF